MDHSATQPHMGEVEGASSMFGMLGENNVGEHFGSRRSTVRTQNAHQSIVAQTVHSNEGINFGIDA